MSGQYQQTWQAITTHPEWGALPQHVRDNVARKFAQKYVRPAVGSASPAMRSFIQENITHDAGEVGLGDRLADASTQGLAEGRGKSVSGLAYNAVTGTQNEETGSFGDAVSDMWAGKAAPSTWGAGVPEGAVGAGSAMFPQLVDATAFGGGAKLGQLGMQAAGVGAKRAAAASIIGTGGAFGAAAPAITESRAPIGSETQGQATARYAGEVAKGAGAGMAMSLLPFAHKVPAGILNPVISRHPFLDTTAAMAARRAAKAPVSPIMRPTDTAPPAPAPVLALPPGPPPRAPIPVEQVQRAMDMNAARYRQQGGSLDGALRMPPAPTERLLPTEAAEALPAAASPLLRPGASPIGDTPSRQLALGSNAPAPVRPSIPEVEHPPTQNARMNLADAKVDAPTYQFKETNDPSGVTERLRGVKAWDPEAAEAHPVIVHERLDGTRFVADGHQRTGLARRLQAEGQAIPDSPVLLLREADGWTVDKAVTRAARHNIQQGTGSAVDVAKLVRNKAFTPEDLSAIPPNSANFRDGQAIASLSDEAFRAVTNGKVPPNQAAHVGRVLRAPDEQEAAMRLLQKTKPESSEKALHMVKMIEAMGFEKTTQGSLFGDQVVADPMIEHAATILTHAGRALSSDRNTFGRLLRNEGRVTEVKGNRVNVKGSRDAQEEAHALEALLTKYGHEPGPVRDVVREQAHAVARGEASPAEGSNAVLAALEREYRAAKKSGKTWREQLIGKAAAAADALESSGRRDIKATRGRLYSGGFDPAALFGYAKVLAAHLLRGAVDRAAWAADMVKTYGRMMHDHADTIWEMAQTIVDNPRLQAHLAEGSPVADRNMAPASIKALSPDDMVARGESALVQVLTEQKDFERAMFRPDLGFIDFLFGNKKGSGVRHLIHSRRRGGAEPLSTLIKMAEVIQHGHITTPEPYGRAGAERINIEHEGYRAVIGLEKRASGDGWLLTGFKMDDAVANKNASGETGGFGDPTSPTHPGPIRTRPGEVAEADPSVSQLRDLFNDEDGSASVEGSLGAFVPGAIAAAARAGVRGTVAGVKLAGRAAEAIAAPVDVVKRRFENRAIGASEYVGLNRWGKALSDFYTVLQHRGPDVPVGKIRALFITNFGVPPEVLELAIRAERMAIGEALPLERRALAMAKQLDAREQIDLDLQLGERSAIGNRPAVADELAAMIDDLGAKQVEVGALTREAWEKHRGYYLPRAYEDKFPFISQMVRDWVQTGQTIKGFQERGNDHPLTPSQFHEMTKDWRIAREQGDGMVDVVTSEGETRTVPKRVGQEMAEEWEFRGYGGRNGKRLTQLDAAIEGLNRAIAKAQEEGDVEAVDRHAERLETATEEYLTLLDDPGTAIVAHRDYTLTERDEKGQIRQASMSIGRLTSKYKHNRKWGLMFRDIARNPDLAIRAEDWPHDDPPSGYTLLDERAAAGTRTPKWGELAGHFVRDEVAGYLRANYEWEGWARKAKQLTGMNAFKKNKTLYNSAYFLNNIMVNTFPLEMAGGSVLDLPRAVRHLYEDSDLARQMEELGSIRRGDVPKDLGATLKDLEVPGLNPWEIVHRVITSPIRRYEDAAGRFAQGSDDMYKVALVMAKMRDGMHLQEAVDLADKVFYSPDRISSPLSTVLGATFVPFVKPFFYGLNVYPKLIMENPAKAMLLLGYFEAYKWVMDEIGGTNDPDYKEGRQALLRRPLRGELNMVPFPSADKFGNPRVIDTRNFSPFNQFDMEGQTTDPTINSMMPGGLKVPLVGEMGLPTGLAPGGIPATLYQAYIGKDGFSGRDLRDPKTGRDDTAEFLKRGLLPMQMVDKGQKVLDAVAGRASYGGVRYDVPTALMNFAGLKVQPLDAEASRQGLVREAKGTLAALESELKYNRTMAARNPQDAEFYQKEVARIRQAMRELVIAKQAEIGLADKAVTHRPKSPLIHPSEAADTARNNLLQRGSNTPL